MRIEWTGPALADLDNISSFIGQDDHEAAAHILRCIRDAVRSLPAHPGIGRLGRVPGTRELVLAGLPFILPYRVRSDVIEILRVFHSSRRWPRRFSA